MNIQVVNPINGDTDNIHLNIKDSRQSKKHNSQLKLVKYSRNVILFAVIYISLTYLGKVFIYLICAPTCDTKNRFITKKNSKEIVDTCSCYKEIEVDNYWTTFNNSPVEFKFAFVITAFLYICCTKCCK